MGWTLVIDISPAVAELLTAIATALAAFFAYLNLRSFSMPSVGVRMDTHIGTYGLPPPVWLDLVVYNGGPGVAREVQWKVRNSLTIHNGASGYLPSLPANGQPVVRSNLPVRADGATSIGDYSVELSWARFPFGRSSMEFQFDYTGVMKHPYSPKDKPPWNWPRNALRPLTVHQSWGR